MNTISIAKLAASALVLSTTMIGCSMSGTAERPGAVSDGQSAKMAAVAANRASKALGKKQIDRAVALAEAAVEAQPRDAGYRMLLGQVYLSAGRFQSAQQSFADTLTLDPEREKAALNLALTQIALGKPDAAKSTLSDYRDKLPAADFGLAIALAGDAEEAVRVLEFATRAPDANATTRQNLALAYALAGKWNNARVMAVQDLTAEDADARITQWAQFARPGGAPSQVAALLGTQPNADAGQPTRLALAPMASPVQAAAAEVDIPPVAPAEPESATVAAASAVAYETPVEPAPVALALDHPRRTDTRQAGRDASRRHAGSVVSRGIDPPRSRRQVHGPARCLRECRDRAARLEPRCARARPYHLRTGQRRRAPAQGKLCPAFGRRLRLAQ